MEPFRQHSGLVAPLDRANVDTDAIIPKQFLKSIKRTGFGEKALAAMVQVPADNIVTVVPAIEHTPPVNDE